MKRRKQNHKISFHFFAAPPCTPRLLNGLVRKFLVLVRDQREREARTVRTTTKSERTIGFKATTRSARALFFKILRILFIKSSNFVQETPQIKQRLPLWESLLYLRRGWDSNPRYPFRHTAFRVRPVRPLWHPSRLHYNILSNALFQTPSKRTRAEKISNFSNTQ